MSSFLLPAGYGWVLLEAVIIGVELMGTGMSITRARDRLFSKEFFDKQFPHLKPHPQHGYPDMGQGRFADKLSDSDWIEFNNYQRSHYNFVEGVVPALTALLVSGLSYPRFATAGGLVYIVGRAMYTYGYRTGGPSARGPGALTLDLALVALTGASILSAWQLGGGWYGLQKLIGIA